MDKRTVDVCIAIAESVKLKAEAATERLSYGELYGEQCKIEAANEIINGIRQLCDGK